jgi:hypothetical protein
MVNDAIQVQLIDAAQYDPTVAHGLAAIERGLYPAEDGLALTVIALAAQVKSLRDVVVRLYAERPPPLEVSTS